MSITPFQVTLWIELLAAGLGGLQGALFAAGVRSRRIDVLGVIVIGLAVSLGGSLLRDMVLNQPPVVVWTNRYLLVAGASAILGMLLHMSERAGAEITKVPASNAVFTTQPGTVADVIVTAARNAAASTR